MIFKLCNDILNFKLLKGEKRKGRRRRRAWFLTIKLLPSTLVNALKLAQGFSRYWFATVKT